MLTPPRLLAASVFGVSVDVSVDGSVDVSIFSSTIIKDNPLHSQPKKVFFYWFFMDLRPGRHHSLIPLLLTDSNLFRALGILFF